MKTVIYDWIRNMVFYQLLTSIILNMVPNDTYQKYIRFFLGMLFLLIAVSPVLQVLKLTEEIDLQYSQKMLEQMVEENSIRFNMED